MHVGRVLTWFALPLAVSMSFVIGRPASVFHAARVLHEFGPTGVLQDLHSGGQRNCTASTVRPMDARERSLLHDMAAQWAVGRRCFLCLERLSDQVRVLFFPRPCCG